jgi:putative flippase GtrA
MDTETIWPFLSQFLRFCLVGAFGLLIDFGLTYLVKEKMKMNKYVANGIGFFAAASSNYFLNRLWTFSSQDPNMLVQYMKFISFAFVGLLLNTAIVWFLAEKRNQNFYVAKGIATVIVTLWNFFSNFFFTFR